MNNSTISSVDSVTLSGIEIDNKLNFENHVSTICEKASRQLNPISRLQEKRDKKEVKRRKKLLLTLLYTLISCIAY